MNDPAARLRRWLPPRGEEPMKYICMGYYEPAKLAAMTEDERNAYSTKGGKRMFTRELPEAVWQGDISSGSFDLRSSRLPGLARRSGRQGRTFPAN
jgi:hypothetical protein